MRSAESRGGGPEVMWSRRTRDPPRDRRLTFAPPMRRRSPQRGFNADEEEPEIKVFEQTLGTLSFDHISRKWFFVRRDSIELREIHPSKPMQDGSHTKLPSAVYSMAGPEGYEKQGYLHSTQGNAPGTKGKDSGDSQQSGGGNAPATVPPEVMRELEDILSREDHKLTEADRLNSLNEGDGSVWSGIAESNSSISKRSCWNECLINSAKKTKKKNNNSFKHSAKRGKENRNGKENKSEKKRGRPCKVQAARGRPCEVQGEHGRPCEIQGEHGRPGKIEGERGILCEVKRKRGRPRKIEGDCSRPHKIEGEHGRPRKIVRNLGRQCKIEKILAEVKHLQLCAGQENQKKIKTIR